jgi:DNA-binding response OmpR family regulator
MIRKALVVENGGDVGPILAKYLRDKALELTILRESHEAAAWVHEHRPEIVFLDVQLSDADAYAICQDLKLDHQTNRVPVVLLTPLGSPPDRVRGIQVGANSYLCKPFSADQVDKAVREVFAWRDQLENHGTQGEIHFRLQSDTRHLEELNQLLSSLFRFSGLSRSQITHLITAVREIGLNAIEWGHRNQVDEILTVIYRIDPEKITIIIRDRGPGFDPANVPHAARAEDPLSHLTLRENLGLREGGFGLLVARGLVDELQFNDAGNEARLVKYFPPLSTAQERPAG